MTLQNPAEKLVLVRFVELRFLRKVEKPPPDFGARICIIKNRQKISPLDFWNFDFAKSSGEILTLQNPAEKFRLCRDVVHVN